MYSTERMSGLVSENLPCGALVADDDIRARH